MTGNGKIIELDRFRDKLGIPKLLNSSGSTISAAVESLAHALQYADKADLLRLQSALDEAPTDSMGDRLATEAMRAVCSAALAERNNGIEAVPMPDDNSNDEPF